MVVVVVWVFLLLATLMARRQRHTTARSQFKEFPMRAHRSWSRWQLLTDFRAARCESSNRCCFFWAFWAKHTICLYIFCPIHGHTKDLTNQPMDYWAGKLHQESSVHGGSGRSLNSALAKKPQRSNKVIQHPSKRKHPSSIPLLICCLWDIEVWK